MGYTPDNNPYIPGDPYSYDLKWLVSQIKQHSQILATLDEKISAMISEFLDQHDPVYYENADALISSDQKNGSLAYIEGFYNPGDGGNNLYFVTTDYNDIISAPFYLTFNTLNKWAIPVMLAPYIMPEMFGAAGDGTTDDTAAVATALKFKNVVLTKAYKCGSLIIENDVNISGSGQIITEDATISASGSFQIVINGVSFDMSQTNRDNTPLISFTSCTLVDINECKFNFANYKGIWIKDTILARFRNNVATGDGSIIEFNQTNGEITGNNIDYNAAADSHDYHAVDFRANNGAVYHVNINSNHIRAYANCIQCSSMASASARFVDIFDNYLYSLTENALKFDGVRNGSARNNTVDNCQGFVSVLGRNGITENLTIKDNRILDFDVFIVGMFSLYQGNYFKGLLHVENNYCQAPSYSNAVLIGGSTTGDDNDRTVKNSIVFKNNEFSQLRSILTDVQAQRHINNAALRFENNRFDDLRIMGDFGAEVWPNVDISWICNNINMTGTSTVIRYLVTGDVDFIGNIIYGAYLLSIRMIGQGTCRYFSNFIKSPEASISLIWLSNDGTTYPTVMYDSNNVSSLGVLEAYPYTTTLPITIYRNLLA